VPVTAAGSVQFSYGRASDDSALVSDNAKSWGLQYQHNLSKRTTAYAGYTRVSNDRNSGLGNVLGVTPTTAGDNATIWGGGLRHSF
jgi:predicted porin